MSHRCAFFFVSQYGLQGQRCSLHRSLGLLPHLYVLRFVSIMHRQASVLTPDNIDLPVLDPALAGAHMRLSRAVQTGCSGGRIEEHHISMMRNRVEDGYDRAVEMPEFC